MTDNNTPVMEKILVTTDLSANSRSAMRFAIQLAGQRNAQVIFLHVNQVLRASFWSDGQYAQYVADHKRNVLQELRPMVRSVYRSMNRSPFNYEIVVHHNLDVTEGILEYAQRCHAAYICTSTRGAGAVRKLFGTHTTALIEQSPQPVICIPARQRVHPVSEVVYASDITDYMHELKDVIAFARPIQARVTLFHMAYHYEFRPDIQLMEASLQKQLDYPVQVSYFERDTGSAMAEDIETAIKQIKHAVLAIFSEQQQGLLENLLVPGNACELSFHAKQVFISFPKRSVPQLADSGKNRPISSSK